MLRDLPATLLSDGAESFRKGTDSAEEKHPGAKKQPRKILVVDDEHLIADTLAEILNRSGFVARAAYSAERALQIAKRFHPDDVLADILMPSMNGVELAIALRKWSSQLRILLFSGQANSPELLSEARQLGYHFEVIAKPIHPEKLIQVLRERRR